VTPPPPPRNDIAIIEAGDARITRIDGVPIHTGNDWAFDVRPGSHTVEISMISLPASHALIPITVPALGSLCLKARGGRRYRIKCAVIDGRPRVFFIDKATGQPPKTPCGPDEDDD